MHVTGVVFTMGEELPYSALCSCGWSGEHQRRRLDAEQEGAVHEMKTLGAAEGQSESLFSLACDLSRTAGEAAQADAPRVAMIWEAREQAMREGREDLAAALLSELEAAKPNLLAILGPNGLESQVIAARATWKAFAEHIRQWLGAGAPERPVLDRAWELINAEGGRPACASADGKACGHCFECGCLDAIDKALRIIEELGGMDPARRKAVTK